MIKEFYLPGLNSKSQKDFKKNEEFETIKQTIQKDTHNFLYDFLFAPNHFYRENFNALEKCKIREKRLIEFETPNRAKITHEYDIQVKSKDVYKDYNYLFNPRNRLSWLKIKQEGKRILIADNDTKKEIVKSKLDSNLKLLFPCKNRQDLFFDYIWETQIGYPCFIKLEDIKRENFLIEAEYYDSIKEDSENVKNGHLFSPFEERNISYEYYPLKKFSSWLYIRAPKNFNLTIDDNNLEYNENVNQVDCYNEEKNNENSDPDIKTLTIINLNEAQEEDYIVKLKFGIRIPKSLRIWFQSIYFISVAVVLLSFFNLINQSYLKFFNPIFENDFIGKIVNHDSFPSIIIALFAGIIATRGWMISEETILKKYSKYLTYIMLALIVIPLMLCLIK